jgi:phage repressor protein C with HTH and peptisase S24 domain
MKWSEFLGILLKDFRMSENQLAQATGLTQTTINRISSGKTKLPYQVTVRQLEEGLKIKIDDRDPDNITYTRISDSIDERLDGAGQVWYYPVLATVYAGEAEMLDHQTHDRSEPYTYNKKGHRCYSLVVSGKSMETTLRDGDTVLVDMDIALENNCLVAVKLKNGMQYIKRYHDLNYAFVKLTSDNPDYDVRLIDKNDIIACHRVVQINLSV